MSGRARVSVLGLTIVLLALLLPAPAASPQAASGAPTIALVVDTSGSMGEPDGGATGRVKIEGARAALLNFLGQLEEDTVIGLRTYPEGNGSCDDGRERFPLARRDPATMAAVIRTLAPEGGTPTAEALRAAADDMRDRGMQNGVIVLVSDGESTCGDPCQTAREIEASGIELDVLTVGFAISEGGAEELRCIADATGGSYVAADDVDQLHDELERLTGAMLTLRLSHPDTVMADVGVGPEGLVEIDAVVRNTSELAARNVVARIRFDTRSAPGVGSPVRALGNVEGGAERTARWTFRPALLMTDRTLRFDVVVRSDDDAEELKARGEIRVVDGTERDDAGALLRDAGRIAIMGDSYSAGEGSKEYLTGTDVLANRCHRSRHTYLMEAFEVPDDLLLACSGALATHVRYPDTENGVAAQSEQLREVQREDPVDLVVLTLGGNDAGFETVAERCLLGLRGCDKIIKGKPAAEYLDDGRVQQLVREELVPAYESIDRELNSGGALAARGRLAPIVVLAYPRIVPGAPRVCPTLYTVSPGELVFLDGFVTRVNAMVEAAVKAAAAKGLPVFFVPTTENAFLPDHTVCDREPYALGVEHIVDAAPEGAALLAALHLRDLVTAAVAWDEIGADKQQLLHPNREGYRAMTRALIRWSSTESAQRAGALKTADRPPVAPRVPAPSFSDMVLRPSQPPYAVRPGLGYPVHLDDFLAGTTVEISVESTPRKLAVVRAAERGVVVTRVILPHDLPPGRHTLHAWGLGQDNNEHHQTIALDVGRSGRPGVAAAVSVLAISPLLVGAQLLRRHRRGSREERSDTDG